jgi:hypothetical protein
LSKATSAFLSVPSTVAVYVFPVLSTVTWIAVALSTTWLLVSTRPSADRIIPVPADVAFSYPSWLVIVTTPTCWAAVAVVAAEGAVPSDDDGPGVPDDEPSDDEPVPPPGTNPLRPERPYPSPYAPCDQLHGARSSVAVAAVVLGVVAGRTPAPTISAPAITAAAALPTIARRRRIRRRGSTARPSSSTGVPAG